MKTTDLADARIAFAEAVLKSATDGALPPLDAPSHGAWRELATILPDGSPVGAVVQCYCGRIFRGVLASESDAALFAHVEASR